MSNRSLDQVSRASPHGSVVVNPIKVQVFAVELRRALEPGRILHGHDAAREIDKAGVAEFAKHSVGVDRREARGDPPDRSA